MKFIEDEKFVQLTQDMSDAVFGTRVINSRIECFSCKRAGGDKKYAHELGRKFMHEIEISDAQQQDQLQRERSEGIPSSSFPPSSSSSLKPCLTAKPGDSSAATDRLSSSPLGDFHRTVTRRLLTDLILTLNASFPDYDFSDARPDQFLRLRSHATAVHRANERLSEFVASRSRGPEFLHDLWRAIDDVVLLKDSEIYSYDPEDTDFLSCALTDGGGEADRCSPRDNALWSFNYFFVNKALKRIVLFTCVQSMLCDHDPDGAHNYDHPSDGEDDHHHPTMEFDLEHAVSLP